MTKKGIRYILIIIELLLIAACFAALTRTDSYYFPYLVFGVIAVVCLFRNIGKEWLKYKSVNGIMTILFSLVFALMITFSNYGIWVVGGKKSMAILGVMLLGAYLAARQIFTGLVYHKDTCFWKERIEAKHSVVAFLIPFVIIALINLSLLFLCKYPGVLTEDSIWQMHQVMNGEYSNHHPFYHTMIIKALVMIGLALFQDINRAVALYMVVQILFMAMAFAFVVFNVYKLRAPIWIMFLMTAFFAFMPYHILYSMTMWKDILFGGMVLLYTMFLFRCLWMKEKTVCNLICLALTGMGVCLLRSNGLFAFVGATIVFVILWRLREKKMLFVMVAVIALSFVLKHPVLEALEVTQPDLIESLSIPSQQIARDIIENDDMTDDQEELIEEVIDIEMVPEIYKPWLSNPIKNEVRAEGNQEVIVEKAPEFAELYLDRSLEHPSSYVKAWIDQTRGYWNSGYPYWVTSDNMLENDLGLYRDTKSDTLNKAFDGYTAAFTVVPVLRIFESIGVFVWLVLIALFWAIVRRDKISAILTMPLLVMELSLLISTPVYSEFRYAYAFFCTIPLIYALGFRKEKNHGQDRSVDSLL